MEVILQRSSRKFRLRKFRHRNKTNDWTFSTSEINATIIGDRSLSSRPMDRVIKPLEKINVSISHTNGLLPIKILESKKIHV